MKGALKALPFFCAYQPRATIHRSRFPLCVTFIQLVSVVLVFPGGLIQAQNSAPPPNSDPTYQSLRNLTLSGESVSVSNVKLKREAGTFHLRSGSVCFVAAVNGKVTGAVFTGDGNFSLIPPESERGMLKLLTSNLTRLWKRVRI